MEQIKININGIDKLASGLTKETTVQEIKFAMLYSTDPLFNPKTIEQFGLFEQSQSEERLLDNSDKIYKILKRLKLNHDEKLSHVKFVIKTKYNAARKSTGFKKQYKYCSLSPSIQKTWNENLIQKNKSSYVRKQLEKLNQCSVDYDNRSISSIPSSAWSSANEDSEPESEFDCGHIRKRYASIRKDNRSRNSSVKRIITGDNNDIQNKSLEHIKKLKNELQSIRSQMINVDTNIPESMRSEMNNIDNLIMVKTNMITSLEQELKRLSNLKCSKLSTSDSLTSIGSSDTGISSCISDDDNKLETLV